jgi:CRP/FNR family transcriptional regulator, cyclic AMP receptor protein
MPTNPIRDAEYLRGVSIFANLTEEQLAAVAPCLRPSLLPPHTIVFHQNQPADTLYIVVDGIVRVFLTGQSGGEMTIDILSKGEVLGELAVLGPHPRAASAMTLTEVHLLALGGEDLPRLLACPEFVVNVLTVLAGRLRAVTAFAAELVLNDLRGRVAHVLLSLAERHGQQDGDAIALDLALTQSGLAVIVGSSRESVNRVLGDFRDHGLVAVHGPRITLLRPNDLAGITSLGTHAPPSVIKNTARL